MFICRAVGCLREKVGTSSVCFDAGTGWVGWGGHQMGVLVALRCISSLRVTVGIALRLGWLMGKWQPATLLVKVLCSGLLGLHFPQHHHWWAVDHLWRTVDYERIAKGDPTPSMRCLQELTGFDIVWLQVFPGRGPRTRWRFVGITSYFGPQKREELQHWNTSWHEWHWHNTRLSLTLQAQRELRPVRWPCWGEEFSVLLTSSKGLGGASPVLLSA